jgi:putative hydrolase of the HAD superfamily
MSASPTVIESGADLRHIDTWLFDLDNTLYPLESGLAEVVSAKITDFVAELTGLPRDEARTLQKRYLADYGLTLSGLLTHHGVDPNVYHAMFHDLPLDSLEPDEALIAGLKRLPGRRLIFTNADGVHAARVLERLGLADLFEDVFHIASSNFTPKPKPEAFARIIAAHAITPATTAFFEDFEPNLAPAAALGMTTVLVGPAAAGEATPFVSYRTTDLAAFLAGARVKEEP